LLSSIFLSKLAIVAHQAARRTLKGNTRVQFLIIPHKKERKKKEKRENKKEKRKKKTGVSACTHLVSSDFEIGRRALKLTFEG
jgi:hypothetical protein